MCKGFAATVGALLLAAASAVDAGGFSLSPTGLSISAREASGSVVVENTSDAPTAIQVRIEAWNQRDGKDSREETRDLIVNPPIFKLAPGEQQLVRFASRRGPPRDNEQAYRAVFSEVPSKEATRSEPGFRVVVAMDIPVYLEPAAAAAPAAILWRAERTMSGVRLHADNPGNVHYRIVEAHFVADGKTLHRQGIFVVLPKSHRTLDLPTLPAGATVIHLSAQDSASEPVAIDIPLPPAS